MAGTGVGALTPLVKVKGTALAAAWLDLLVHASVDRGIGLIGRVQLRFLDPGFALASAGLFEIGAAVEVAAPGRGGALATGVVSAVELQQTTAGATPELLVTVVDRAERLQAVSRSRTFLNQTAKQVIEAVAAGCGVKTSVRGGGTLHTYLLQTGTDLAFLDHLIQRSGLVWWIDSDGVLQVRPAGVSHDRVPLELGSSLRSFQVRATAAAPDQVLVSGWDTEQQTSVSATVTADSAAPKVKDSTFVAGATGRGPDRRGWKATALAATPAPLDSAEAGTFAQAMAAEAAASAVTMQGMCPVDARLQPGVTVEVTGAGPAAGEYVLTHVEHVHNRTGFHTRITSGSVRRSGLVDLMQSAPAADPGYSLNGVIPAIVTNAHNPEKKSLGLVKVKYPGITGNVESAWARVLTLGAGANRGAVFQPEVGDEVLVAFERGDTRRAVVLGGLFSEKAALPTTDTHDGDKVKFRRITSRNGHVLEFADGNGDKEEHVLLSAKKGAHVFRLGNDRLDVSVGNVPVLISNGAGASIEFTAAGDVLIKGKNVTIESTAGNTTVNAKANLQVKGMSVKAEASATATLKSSGVATIEASGILSIKGAMVAIN